MQKIKKKKVKVKKKKSEEHLSELHFPSIQAFKTVTQMISSTGKS